MLLLLSASPARGEDVPAKYPRLFAAFSALEPGVIVNLADLAIRLDYAEENCYREPGSYYLLYPRDLDVQATDSGPYAKKYPNLHLNLPLVPEKSPTTYLVMSDQPESIREDNEYLGNGGKGTDGLYGRATSPGGKRMRYLADHFNQSAATKWLKVYMTSPCDTTVNVHKKGGSVAENSVVAGSIADQLSHQVNLADIREVRAGTPSLLCSWGPIAPGATGVVLYEMTPNSDVTYWTVITDGEKLNAPALEELESLPKLRSLKWKDREEKLRAYVKADRFPSRFARVLDSYIHARGLFPFPDRVCTSKYDFERSRRWIHAYSTFEYIDGLDGLTADGAPVKTNNRGNYGGYIRLNVRIQSLPAGMNKAAVIAINTSDTLGGMFKTTLNRKKGTSFVFNRTSLSNEVIGQKKAVLLWKDAVQKGDDLDIQFFSLANTSVRLWYLVIPLP